MKNNRSITIINTFIFLLIFFQVSCESRYEAIASEVAELIEMEKYETARDKLIREMKKKRPNDREISDNKPSRPRILTMTPDRRKVAWVEDDIIIAWDLDRDDREETDIESYPETFSISANGKYVLLTLPLKKNQGCKMLAVSLYDGSLKYESGAHVSCKNSGAITNDGKTIYYFIDENIYSEKTENPKKPELMIKHSEMSPPYEKLKNKLVMLAVVDKFIIFFGNGGSYNMYQFIPEKKSVKKIAKDIMVPEIYPVSEAEGYIVGGAIGKMKLIHLDFHTGQTGPEFSIGNKEINAWPTNNPEEFISGDSSGMYLWKKGKTLQECPVLYDRFWGLGDSLIYENEKKKLLLSDTNYSPEEWNLVKLLKEARRKL